MTLCERCGNYPNICGCAEADALAAELAAKDKRLAEAEIILAKLRKYSPSMYREMAHEARCEIAARATDSASGVQK